MAFLYNLKNSIVNTKTRLADYGFIYTQMKDNALLGLDISSKSFLEFLNSKCNAAIGDNHMQLRRKNQKRHQEIFKTYLKAYKKSRTISS